MNEFGHKPKNADLSKIGLGNVGDAYWNLEPAELVEHSILNGQGVFADSGALAIETGEFTGRSPKDRLVGRCQLPLRAFEVRFASRPHVRLPDEP